MDEKIKKEFKDYIPVLKMTAIIWIIVHGYRFMNNIYTSDSLICVFQDDIYWQRSLGRFMQPLTMIFRGVICTPWLILAITILFFSASIFVLSKIFDIQSKLIICLVCIILTCNITWISSVASYLPWVDIYSVAFFLAVLGVWFYKSDNLKGYICGTLCFVFCMGFYQAYIDVALSLLCFLFILGLATKKESVKSTFTKGIKTLAGVASSGLLYFAIYKTVSIIHHVELSSTYNGVAEIGKYEGESIFELLCGAFTSIARAFWDSPRFVSTIIKDIKVSNAWSVLLRICLFLVLIVAALAVVYLDRKNGLSVGEILLQLAFIVVLPFATNFVYFMSKGVNHELMILSFFLLPVYLLVMFENCAAHRGDKATLLWLCFIPLILFMWDNYVYANQAYFKLDMEERASLSKVTRLVSDIEDVEGYVPGITPVVFIGGLEQSSYSVPYLRELYVLGNGNTPFSYDAYSLRIYIEYYLGIYMNVIENPTDDDLLASMGVYPRNDSMAIVDGILYVKLSE